MAISDTQWNAWLNILEDMLHEADLDEEFLFGIHINSAIEAVHAKRGTQRINPHSDEDDRAPG